MENTNETHANDNLSAEEQVRKMAAEGLNTPEVTPQARPGNTLPERAAWIAAESEKMRAENAPVTGESIDDILKEQARKIQEGGQAFGIREQFEETDEVA